MISFQGFFLPGGMELWIILAIILLLFSHRIPGMARSMGSGIVEFKKGLKDEPKNKDGDPPSVEGGPKVTVEDAAGDAEPDQDAGKGT